MDTLPIQSTNHMYYMLVHHSELVNTLRGQYEEWFSTYIGLKVTIDYLASLNDDLWLAVPDWGTPAEIIQSCEKQSERVALVYGYIDGKMRHVKDVVSTYTSGNKKFSVCAKFMY